MFIETVKKGAEFLKKHTLVIMIAVVVIIALLFTLGVWDKKDNGTATNQPTTSGQQAETPAVFRKVSVIVTGDWGTPVSHDSDHTIAVWGFEGLLFKSRRNGWVETLYTSSTRNLFGGAGSNDIQFRTTGQSEGVKYCVYPTGRDWREVCQ